MYRAKDKVATEDSFRCFEFCEMLPTSSLGKYYQGSVTRGTDTAVIFYSDAMASVICEVMHIQFDGTFFYSTYSIYSTLDDFRSYWQAFFNSYPLLDDREK